jgi:hypothetical protein
MCSLDWQDALDPRVPRQSMVRSGGLRTGAAVMFSIPDDILTAHLDGETVLLNMTTKRYFHLNDTGQRVWKLMESGLDTGAIVTCLCDEFEVDQVTVEAEVLQLLQMFGEFGVVQEGVP